MGRREGSWLCVAALVPAMLAALAVVVQGEWASRNESQTWDEAFALSTGFAQVEEGRMDLLAEWPPLLGLATYLPLAALGVRMPPPPPVVHPPGSLASFGRVFLYGLGDIQNPHRRMLSRARRVVIAFTALAVLALVLWAHRLHGAAGAWLAALLSAAEPNWLAHGHLTAWDGIATATMTLALAAAAWFLDRPSFPRAAVLGLASGLAWTAKFSGLLLLPIFALLLLLSSPLAGRWRLVAAERGPSFGRLCAMALLVFLVGALLVGLSYNGSFRYDLYLAGIANIYGQTKPGFSNFLLGEFREAPFPHYYVVALLAKTPLGFLPLLPLGLWATLRGGPRHLWMPAALGALLIMAAVAFDRLNIGVRHAVPALPAMILLAAGAARLGRDTPRAGLALAGAFVLAGLGAVEVWARAPRYLSFFNVAVGGPQGGIEVLDASNIDWGQDLIALERIQREEGIQRLALIYHGSADPAAYGVRSRPMRNEEFLRPRPGVTYAVSLQALHRMAQDAPRRARWLERHEPWRRAGDSIYLFRF